MDIIEWLSKFDIIAISETWCEHEHELCTLRNIIEGFTCVVEKATRTHRHGRPSGGICVFLRSNVMQHVNRIDKGFKFAVILEIKDLVNTLTGVCIGDILLVCTYLPPKNSSAYDEELDGIAILREKLVDLKSRFINHQLLIVGDLNARVGRENDFLDEDDTEHVPGLEWFLADEFKRPRNARDLVVNDFGNSLLDLCIELGIHILNGRCYGDLNGAFTNITENGCSIVDYMIAESSVIDVVESFTVVDYPEANHLPLQCNLQLGFSSDAVTSTTVSVNADCNLAQLRRFKWKIEHRNSFINTLSDENSLVALQAVIQTSETNLNEAVSMFVKVLHRAAEPMEIKSVKHKKVSAQPKWWDAECEEMKTRKFDALRTFKASYRDCDLKNFKNMRNAFKNMCQTKSFQYKENLKERLVQCKSVPAVFWKSIKSITGQQFKQTESIPAVEWFDYFKNLLNKEVKIPYEFAVTVDDFTVSHDAECDVCAGHVLGDDEMQLLNAQITTAEILNCVKNMSNGKAPGVDGVVTEMIKCSASITVPYLKHLYNKVLTTGIFPKEWCQAVLSPLHKKGIKSDPNNYRGIALLSVLGKIFTKIINNRLVTWMEQCTLQREEQAGFRKGYRTVDNIFILQSLIQKYCSRKGGRFYVVFVDFSKAFDTVPHSLLFYQLMKKGVHGKVLNVLRSMYSSLESCVRTPGGITEFFKCSIGTRQGCMLSPCLFSLYVGELISMIDGAGCRGTFVNGDIEIASLLFADDVVVGADTVGRLQKLIDVISAFSSKWNLAVSLPKTKVVVFRNGGPLRHNEKWFYNGTQLEVASCYKYLGSLFTPKLIWSGCQRTLCAQAKRGLFLIRLYDNACGGLPVDLLFDIFDTMIAPILLYSSEIWGFDVANCVEKVQTDFCKSVLKVPTHTSNLAVLGETGRYPLYVKYYKRCISYWLTILQMPDTRYPKACYKMLYCLDQQGRHTWASSVKMLLCKYGFREVWDEQGVGNPAVFFTEFTERVKHVYFENWEYDVSQSSKLCLFRAIKSAGISRESYLYNISYKTHRSSLAKLRCSSHNLSIEKGRHANVQVAERVCKFCLTNTDTVVLEDEYHFILRCPAYADLRAHYLADYMADTDYERFIVLLKDENPDVQRNLAMFIFNAQKLRSQFMIV